MRTTLLKMLDYLDMIDESKRRENTIKTLPFYNMFGRYNQMEEDLAKQRKVTDRLQSRVLQLKKEL